LRLFAHLIMFSVGRIIRSALAHTALPIPAGAQYSFRLAGICA
jgi:hypothetical protein